MKPKLRLLAAVWLAWATTLGANAATYIVTNAPGWNLIANQVTNANGNRVQNLFGSTAPINSRVMRYHLPSKSFQTVEIFTAAGGWLPGTNFFNAGEGLYFSNANVANYLWTNTGNAFTPVLPLNIGTNLVLIARQTNDLGSVTNILGFAPVNGTVVYRFSPGAGRDPNIFAPPHYTVYAFKSNAWAAPNNDPFPIRVGESVWLTTNATAPVIVSGPFAATVCPSNTANFSVTASGVAPLTYQWFFGANPISGATNPSVAIVNVSNANVGNYSVQVSNPMGTTTSSSAALSLIPPPTVVGPSNLVVCVGASATLSASAAGNGPFSFSWTKNGTVQVGQSSSNFVFTGVTTANNGNYCVIVRDACGSTTTNCATLTVGDFAPPQIFCPSNLTVQCSGGGQARATFSVTAIDNCDANPIVTCVPASGSQFPLGVTTVNCTARDASNNTSICSFTVTVVDTTPPVITCPRDVVVGASGPNGARAYFTVTATDGCDTNPIVTCNPPSGSFFPVGTTPVTCSARDGNNNTATCTFNVVVVPAECCQGKFWKFFDTGGPAARDFHAMTYDSQRGRVVLFGGLGASRFGDTWEWDGNSWTLMATNGPSPRYGHAMAYDGRLGATVLFGGLGTNTQGASVSLGDTWFWNGSFWSQFAGGSPPPRNLHSMAYDVPRNRVVMFGGIVSSNGTELNDTWEFNGAQWASIGAPVVPSPRRGMTMAYGVAQNQMLLFGGVGSNTVFQSDTWKWDGSTWSLLTTNGPLPRGFHAMTYNDNCDSIVMNGGLFTTNFLSDTWEWNGTAWSLSTVGNPGARAGHAMAHDSDNDQSILFGGARASQGLGGDTWSFGSDQTPPAVGSIYAPCNDTQVTISFNKPLSPTSAGNPAHYHVTCGGSTVTITQVDVSDDGRIVTLTLASPISSGCVLFVDGVQDVCGHTLRLYQTGIQCANDSCLRGSAGNEYWLTFPGNYAPDATNQPIVQLFITGSAGTIGSVSMPGLVPPFVQSFTIPVSGETTITLPRAADLSNAVDYVETKGVHVVASQKVTVYGYDHIKYTTDAYLGLSTRALGNAYLVTAYQNLFTNVPELSGSQFAVVATVDNTSVIIVPSATSGAHPAGVPYVLTMNRGQTYQLRDTNATPADLSGSIVVADQPIAVFGGHQCANIPSSNVFFCNYVVEQIPPVEQWGTTFVAAPLATRSSSTFRMMALYNTTTVSVNGGVVAVINQGQFYETQLAGNVRINSDKPILVTQYANSADYDFVMNADPFMVIVPPTVSYSSGYTFQAPTTDFPSNYVNVTVPSASASQLALDGAGISAGLFSVIPGTSYSGARVPVSPGTHSLIASNGASFGIIVYGWNEFDAYGYPGGTCSRGRDQTPQFTCPPTNLVVGARGTDCSAPVPDIRNQVGNASAALLITQSPAPGMQVSPGTYPITVTIIDQFGARTLCTTILTVNPPVPLPQNSITCPGDILVFCSSNSGAIVQYGVQYSAPCFPNAFTQCSPASGSLFAPGTNVVTCQLISGQLVLSSCTFKITVQRAATPNITGANQTNGTVSFPFATQAGCSYVVEYKNNLSDVNWLTLTRIAGDGSVKMISDAASSLTKRFYRIRLE